MSSQILKLGTFAIPKVGSSIMGYKPPFFPTDLENCVIWLDNQETDFIKSGAQRVSQWTDKSGLNHHFLQPTGASQPLFVASGINGQNGVRFSNLSNETLNVTLSTTYNQPFEIFTVWNLDVNSSQTTPIVYDRILGSGNRVLLYWTANNVQVGSPTLTTAYAKTRPFNLISNDVVYNGASTQVYENGILKNTLNTGTNGLTTLRLGNAEVVATTTRLSGFICEMIAYSRNLTAGERTTVNNYLNVKYGL
jgi:hypothetical protein